MARSKTAWLAASLQLLNDITRSTHNAAIAPIALQLWERQLQPENPLWRHVTAKPFTVDNKAHVIALTDPRLPGLGIVGFFGCTDVASGQQVLRLACDWLKQQGISAAYGPINGTITKSYRLSFHEDYRVPGEPVNPPLYIQAFKSAGFEVFNRYVSGYTKHYRLFNKFIVRPPKQQTAIKLRPFQDGDQTDDLKTYHQLMNDIFPHMSIYCPVITWEERSYNMADVKPIFNPEFSFFLEDKGRAVGMIIAEPYDNKLCIDVLALLPEYRGRRLSGLLIGTVHDLASQHQLEAAIYGLIRVGNRVYQMRKPGVRVYRRYMTMRKQL